MQLKDYELNERYGNLGSILMDNFSTELDAAEEEEENILRFSEVLQFINVTVPDDIKETVKSIITHKKIPLGKKDGSLKNIMVSSGNKDLCSICQQLDEKKVVMMYKTIIDEGDNNFQEVKEKLNIDLNPEGWAKVDGMKDVAFYYLVMVLKEEGLLNSLHTYPLLNIFDRIMVCDTTDGPELVDPRDLLRRYSLALSPPGICIIWNMTENRKGSEEDFNNVRSLFCETFEYDIIENKDPTKETISKTIEELRKEKYKFYDRLVALLITY